VKAQPQAPQTDRQFMARFIQDSLVQSDTFANRAVDAVNEHGFPPETVPMFLMLQPIREVLAAISTQLAVSQMP
jgi:hypothetical protein